MQRAQPQNPAVRVVMLGFGDLTAFGLWGFTQDMGDGVWAIVLHNGMGPRRMVDVLLHEWGHLLAGYSGTCLEDDHGALFGVCWATAYRAYHGFGEFAEFEDDSACEPNDTDTSHQENDR